jgi:hypothetical protein
MATNTYTFRDLKQNPEDPRFTTRVYIHGPVGVTRTRGGMGESVTDFDVAANERKLTQAYVYESAFKASTHKPLPPAPTEPGNFDTRAPKATCDDLKMAAAFYKHSAEHYDNAKFWKLKLKEKIGSSTDDFRRAEALHELDLLHEPTPPVMSPGITRKGGVAMRVDTQSQGSPDYHTALAGPKAARSIGGGHSVKAWDAYVTVSAPFASSTLVHAPERDAAMRVLESTSSRISASTFYAAGGLSNVRPSTALKPLSATSGPLSNSRGGGGGGGLLATDYQQRMLVDGASSSSSSVEHAPPGGFTTTLENILRSDARIGLGWSSATMVNGESTYNNGGHRSLHPINTQQAGSIHPHRTRKSAVKGFRVDMRDEHALQALVTQQTHADFTHAQRQLLTSRGLPVSAYVDLVDGDAVISSAPHASSLRAVATALSKGGETDTHRQSTHAHTHRNDPPRRFNTYDNIERADLNLKPNWVSHTTKRESEHEMLKEAAQIPVDPSRFSKFVNAKASLGGYGEEAKYRDASNTRRIKLRVRTGSSAQPDISASGESTSVLDDSQWQKTFFARAQSAGAASAASASLDFASAPTSEMPSNRQNSRQQSRQSSTISGPSDASSKVTSGRSSPDHHEERPHKWQTPRDEHATGALTLVGELNEALHNTVQIGTAYSRRDNIEIDRAAAVKSRGASRQRVREDEDERRYPSSAGSVDADAARDLVDSAVSVSHPFVARQRLVEHKREVQNRHGNILNAAAVPHALMGQRALVTGKLINAAATQSLNSSRTVLLESMEMGQEDKLVPAGRALVESTYRGSGTEAHLTATVEAIVAQPRIGSPAPERSQRVPSNLHTSRAEKLSSDATLSAATRSIRTSHSRGRGAGANHHSAGWNKGKEDHNGWDEYMMKGSNVPLASSFGPGHGPFGKLVDPTAFGALQLGIEYAFPFKVRNQSPFARRYQVTAVGLEDSPSVPRGKLIVRSRNYTIAPGLSFTCVLIVCGLEPGFLRGHVHLRTDDGQHFALAFNAHILDELSFIRAREDARATGKLDVLRSLTSRMNAIGSEWDQEYAKQGAVQVAEDTSSSATPPAINTRDAKKAEQALRAVGESGPDFYKGRGHAPSPSNRGEKRTNRNNEQSGDIETTNGEMNGNNDISGREAEVIDTMLDGSNEVQQFDDEIDPMQRVGGGGGGTSPTSTLLRLSQEHHTNPGDLLAQAVEAGVPRKLALDINAQVDAADVTTNGEIRDKLLLSTTSNYSHPLYKSTITSAIVKQAIVNDEPVYLVGDKVVRPTHLSNIDYPEPSELVATKVAGLQQRDHRDSLRGKITVGSGSASYFTRQNERIAAEASFVDSNLLITGGDIPYDGNDIERTSPYVSTSIRSKSPHREFKSSPPTSGNMNTTKEINFSTLNDRPVVRIGPHTAKHGLSSTRALGDDKGRAGSSEIMLRGADFIIPYKGTHKLIVPIV